MKTMVNLIPAGSCPRCGHSQFVVFENEMNCYLTNRDGEIIDGNEIDYRAVGKCVNCGKEFSMIPTANGFIPLTRLRSILLDYTPHFSAINDAEMAYCKDLANPMEAK